VQQCDEPDPVTTAVFAPRVSIAEQIRVRHVVVANLYAAHTEEARLCPIAAGIVKVAGFFVIDPGGLETIARRIP
jgi:hypothetical protein